MTGWGSVGCEGYEPDEVVEELNRTGDPDGEETE